MTADNRRRGELVATYHWLEAMPEFAGYCDKNARGTPVPAQGFYLEAPREGMKVLYVELANDGGLSRVIWVDEELVERRPGETVVS